ncbi:protein kinase domain-containing protein [Chamaesiphon minutus]|uniref:non-specific serine/threonine protein kinase n=1 Tax=Chamaesiphon minutus (strain ATCC 27169 / PCC 6605) TaxID=1173020 RepID=K9UI79_CHAP6|nr:protein kinase [Chamaesiphon minutus]AFY94166.1 serine/threonine protein kinase [Chamaesiphon minutus PCC 6605]
MQPPIPLGTLLQQRYRVTKILGQGGFGRTYLSQDTGCFDEMCVLKEFSPNDRGRDALKKSKELFQREAQVLYQINHPQIPKFRANFEEQKRLFLVQEYAEGKTVAKTLSDRLKNNTTFSEAEAVEFLQNMLPVLSHIHGMGIIHRDISPDNIIFRDRDKLPVLIDFGVVKAGVTQLEVSTQIHQGTTVGKAGYAPGEQLQTGEAYANSDLYALAVTVVVMMTGRKPESLIDKSTMTWKWHQWVPTLTPWFAKILNKMLSRMPNSRYQSANEVAQALRSVSDFVGPSAAPGHATGNLTPLTGIPSRPTTSGYEQPSTTNNSGSVPLSRVKRTTTSVKSSNYSAKNTQPPPQNPLRGILNTPWGTALGSTAAAVIFIIIPLFLVSRSLTTSSSGSKTPTPEPTLATPATDPIATPTPITVPPPVVESVPPSPPVTATTPAPATVTAEALSVEVGKPLVKEGALDPSKPTVFSLNLPVGHKLKASLASTPAGATMNILAPNQANVDVYAKNTVNWEGTLPLAGEYRIEIVPLAGAASNYKLEVITNLAPTPEVSASPAPVSR